MFPAILLLAALQTRGKAPLPAANTRCPVLGERVQPGKSPKVEVRGREYYLCCAGCGPKLKADPDKYLEPDGTPRNAKAGSKAAGH